MRSLGIVNVSLKTNSLEELKILFSDLQPVNSQVGVDDETSGSFSSFFCSEE
jgi:hypothetical protein